MNPKILLIGTGAVGSYFGGRLAQAGASVSTLCRSDYDIVRSSGISIKSIAGNFYFKPEQVMHDISEYKDEPNFIIVATKALPEIQISELIKKTVYPHTAIVLLQNGIGIEDDVASAFPLNEIISGITFIYVTRTSFGFVDHQGYGKISLGLFPTGTSQNVEILAQRFISSGVPCEIQNDIIAARWKKLVWNASFNPISVLGGGATTIDMINSEPTLMLIQEVMKEVILLSEKTGHPVPLSLINTIINDTKSAKPAKTSMLLDYEQKRPMEVEAILGNAVRIAQRYSVSIPYIISLYGLLKLADFKNHQ